LTGELRDAAGLVAEYLRVGGHLPCFDCWEEYGDKQHTATVAAVLAGLSAAGRILGAPAVPDWPLSIVDGSLVKFAGSTQVDGSLLWAALPFGVLSIDDPVMVATAARIESELLSPAGGVRRYLGDTYYGGGDWVLLTAWLGWYRAARGDLDGARTLLAWIENTATPQGLLPEQVTRAAAEPDMVATWVRKWGPVATPLLWSHAMYLILADVLGYR
jgi:GH15 family glucan-1,4-alpha-glucosidase